MDPNTVGILLGFTFHTNVKCEDHSIPAQTGHATQSQPTAVTSVARSAAWHPLLLVLQHHRCFHDIPFVHRTNVDSKVLHTGRAAHG